MSSNPRIRAALLDLDGTLVDSIGDIAAAANAMLAELGLPVQPLSVVSTYVGKGARHLVQRCLSESPDPRAASIKLDDAMVIMMAKYREHNGRHCRIFDGVVDGLRQMRAQDVKLAVVTNKPEFLAIDLMEKIGLADYVEFTMGPDSAPQPKPAPDMLWLACERLGVSRDEAVMIGDSGNDSQAGRAAGMPVLIVPYGYNEGHSVHELDVDAIVPTLRDAADWIARR